LLGTSLADPGVRNYRTGLLRESAHETGIAHMVPEPVSIASRELDAVAGSIRVGDLGWGGLRGDAFLAAF
jgi:hypothetical protein